MGGIGLKIDTFGVVGTWSGEVRYFFEVARSGYEKVAGTCTSVWGRPFSSFFIPSLERERKRRLEFGWPPRARKICAIVHCTRVCTTTHNVFPFCFSLTHTWSIYKHVLDPVQGFLLPSLSLLLLTTSFSFSLGCLCVCSRPHLSLLFSPCVRTVVYCKSRL